VLTDLASTSPAVPDVASEPTKPAKKPISERDTDDGVPYMRRRAGKDSRFRNSLPLILGGVVAVLLVCGISVAICFNFWGGLTKKEKEYVTPNKPELSLAKPVPIVNPVPPFIPPTPPQPIPQPVPPTITPPKPTPKPAPVPTPTLKPASMPTTKAGIFEAPGIQFESPCAVAADGFSVVGTSTWVGKFGRQHGNNPWMTDQFYFSANELKPALGKDPTEYDYLALLERVPEYARHKRDEQKSKKMITLGGQPCLEVRLQQNNGPFVKAESREFNVFLLATDDNRLAVFDFKTFGAEPDPAIVKGIVDSFKFVP
jgi:hypothetical protein